MKANNIIRPGRCPYCGGHCDLARTCFGRRTDDPAENTCLEMQWHLGLVAAAAMGDPGEVIEATPGSLTH